MMFRAILSAFVSLSIAVSCWADPPRIVATPAVEVVVVPAGDPVKLDVGKFVWLHVSTDKEGKPIDRPVSWDFSDAGIVEQPAEGGDLQWGGWLQGAARPAWHKVPKGSVPIFGGGEQIDAGKFKFFEVPTIGEVRIGGTKQGEPKAGWHKPANASAVPVIGVAKGLVKVSAWVTAGDDPKTARPSKVAELVLSVDGGKPTPKPDDPKPDDPKPDDPKPPVTSFRVILGYESGSIMTPAQTSVLSGGVVEQWLDANCTGGRAGWRRRDKDPVGLTDPSFAAMWKAVQENISIVPFAAVEINGGKPIIIPFEPTPAAMVAKLKTYSGGK